jgi:uncharacterized protein (DUF2141 family)
MVLIPVYKSVSRLLTAAVTVTAILAATASARVLAQIDPASPPQLGLVADTPMRVARSDDTGISPIVEADRETLKTIQASDLKVEIEGVRSGSGTIMIGLYDNADGFIAAIKHSTEVGLLNDKTRLAGMALRAAPGTRNAVFMQLPPGQYAIIVFHDENDNGRLDENAWGVPTEGYGFSNNAQGILGAPSFDAAKITLDGTKRSVAVSLIYPVALSTLDLSELAK